MDTEQQDQRMGDYGRDDLQQQLLEGERQRRERLPRTTLEIASHEGADPLAVRAVVRKILSLMQMRNRPMNQYSLEYLEEALDTRVWRLPLEGMIEPGEKEEADAMREEVTSLDREIDARANLQGAYDVLLSAGANLEVYGDLLLKPWKVTPTAEDFWTLGNLSPTPESVKEIEEIVVGPWRTTETQKMNKAGEWVTTAEERKRDKRLEVVGYEGVVKEGESSLGSKVDKALRRFVDLSIIKSPVWALQDKVFPTLSEDEIGVKQQQIREALGIGDEELATLSNLGGDKSIQEKTDATREFVRRAVENNEDAERIAYQLYYIMELATKFALSGTREKPDIEGFPSCTDLFNLFHFEERRRSERSKRRPAGPPSTLGCYPGLAVSFMDFVKVDDPMAVGERQAGKQVSFWTLWYERKTPFGELPWKKVLWNIFDFHLIQRWKGNDVRSNALKTTDWDTKDVFNPEFWRKMTKSIQLAIGMLGLGSEVSKKYGEEKTKALIKAVKFNLLGGAVISNLNTAGWITGSTDNPSEVLPTQTWDKALRIEKIDKTMGLLKYIIVDRAEFLDDNEWGEWKKKVIGHRRGIRVDKMKID